MHVFAVLVWTAAWYPIVLVTVPVSSFPSAPPTGLQVVSGRIAVPGVASIFLACLPCSLGTVTRSAVDRSWSV